MKEIIVAVAGQPNSGKSTIFNMLTGARQHVANYPGVTVEKRTGKYSYEGNAVTLVDLPGTYSLTSYSQEERIARDFLLHEKPDVVLDIVDAANLERNLYLTFQLGEMGIPLVIALNMMDIAEDRGFKIDKDKLGELLAAPVVPTVGNKGKGKKELKETISATYKNRENGGFRIDYGQDLESILNLLEKRLSEDPKISARYPARWLAVKLIEGDNEARRLVQKVEES
jgi:ferrous iron transport protein B